MFSRFVQSAIERVLVNGTAGLLAGRTGGPSACWP